MLELARGMRPGGCARGMSARDGGGVVRVSLWLPGVRAVAARVSRGSS
jgi:hypothetical protein